MSPLDRARVQVHQAVRESRAPVVAVSFGKDSLLLLALAREVQPDISCLWYRDAQSPAQRAFARSIIKEWCLNVYSYGPNDTYLLTDNGASVLVQEYAMGESRLPLATDISLGETCSLTTFPTRAQPLFLPWDALLVGYKDCDTHWLKGGAQLFADGYRLGRLAVHAPIRHLTDDQVRAALYELNVPYKELDDQVSLCTACMTHNSDEVWCPEQRRYIPRVQWDAEQSLAAFRARFNLTESEEN